MVNFSQRKHHPEAHEILFHACTSNKMAGLLAGIDVHMDLRIYMNY
jgi:hypothetical protein